MAYPWHITYNDTSCIQACGEISVENKLLSRDKYCHGVVDSTGYTLCY